MEPIIEKKLDELLKLTEENNKMLLKMRKAQKWATVMRMVYWFIIIGLAAGSFYFIKPYFNNILNVYKHTIHNYWPGYTCFWC